MNWYTFPVESFLMVFTVLLMVALFSLQNIFSLQ